ncbi:MAG: hypothetical protein KatS3mg118_0419 [Paracoccaceae bacterium]|nr:MAG: hypothetical protein D6686_13650 [Alphaproteobacteria bacterium]GIX12460.1 MAG: hypothetical protein KatS3mg118_0419 [Paracoccaceae bacterium]
MKLPELSAAIGEKSGVPARTAQRVLRQLFDHVLSELEGKDELVLPGLGRMVKRTSPDGRTRILFIPRRPDRDRKAGADESAPEA